MKLAVTVAVFIFLGVLVTKMSPVSAQSCTGTVTCCTAGGLVWDCPRPMCDSPQGPHPNCINLCSLNTGSCTQQANHGCGFQGAACNIWVPDSLCNYRIGGSCTATFPTPTPGSGSGPPASGSCTSGDCFQGIANCGAVGRDPGAGSCSGGLCCRPRSGYVPGCPYDVGQTGYPSCRFSEGNGCNAACSPPWGTCSGCADGLVGGGCGCPSCSLSVNPDSVIVTAGTTRDVAVSITADWGLNPLFRYAPAGVASIQRIGNTLRITGLTPGFTSVTVDGWWSGYSPRSLCSDILNITVVPAPTPTLANCAPMGAINGAVTCTSSMTNNGTISWTWPHVAGVTFYDVTFLNSSGGVISSIQIGASLIGCSSGTCTYVSNNLANSSFRLEVRPAVSTTCIVPASSTSSALTAVPVCSAVNMNVIGKYVTQSGNSCNDVAASTSYVSPITFSMAPALSPVSLTQNGSSAVVWNAPPPNTYTVSSVPPIDTQIIRSCWSKTGGAPWTTALTALVNSGETVTWQLGYILGRAWSRVEGGDAQICGTVTSMIPASLGADRLFMKNGSGGYPGIVFYGSDYDFDSSVTMKGSDLVSSTDWLVQEGGTFGCSNEWYEYLMNRYGIQERTADRSGGTYAQNTFPSREEPYKVDGDLTTQGNWTYNSDGSNVVIFVDGDLRINGEIKVNSRSFVGFVVSGDIHIDSSVGGDVTNTTSDIDGVYVTSGTFHTGQSSNAATPKLIVNGIVIARGFTLQRDLDAYGANNTQPSEEFRYNPMYLMTLPDKFLDMDIKWGEVAP